MPRWTMLLAAIHRFLNNFRTADRGKRYTAEALPERPFADDSFERALCIHYPFLYSPLLSLQYPMDSLCQRLRVAREMRLQQRALFYPRR